MEDLRQAMDDGTGDLEQALTGTPKTIREEDRFPDIEIEAPNLWTIYMTIEGRTPLLTANISDYTIRTLKKQPIKNEEKEAWEKLTDGKKLAQFEAAVYRDEAGRPAFPARGIRKAMLTAGAGDDFKTSYFLRHFFNVSGAELVPINESEPAYREDPARNKNYRNSLCMAVRAQYRRPWSMIVPMIYNRNRITAKKLVTLLNLAGFSVGIGCWRPEKNGVFGQFVVTSFDQIKDTSLMDEEDLP